VLNVPPDYAYFPVALNIRSTIYFFAHFIVEIYHSSDGFDNLMSNELTTPEFTIANNGTLLDITLYNEASTFTWLDVYMSNSLGHHLPGRIFSSVLPQTLGNETIEVG